jgi:hypothetical protein
LQSTIIAGVLTVASIAWCQAAGAAQYDIHVSPSSGPAGTTVSLSGSHCSPGVSVDASADFVRLASTLFTVQVAVAANGSWHTTAIIGGLPVPGPAPITATCFTDGNPSQDTQYNPATFTVTSSSAPTTRPGSTPTAKPGSPSNNAGGSTSGGGAGASSNGGATSNGGGSANGSGSASGGGRGSGGGSSAAGSTAGATTPSSLGDPVVDPLGIELGTTTTGARVDRGGGLTGWWWLLLILALAAGAGLGCVRWYRRARGATDEVAV